MGLSAPNGDTSPPLSYDRLHLERWEILHPTQERDDTAPVYIVKLYVRRYDVINGKRYYKSGAPEIVCEEDFVTLAMTKAAQGDMRLLKALEDVQASVAAIYEVKTGVNSVEII